MTLETSLFALGFLAAVLSVLRLFLRLDRAHRDCRTEEETVRGRLATGTAAIRTLARRSLTLRRDMRTMEEGLAAEWRRLQDMERERTDAGAAELVVVLNERRRPGVDAPWAGTVATPGRPPVHLLVWTHDGATARRRMADARGASEEDVLDLRRLERPPESL